MDAAKRFDLLTRGASELVTKEEAQALAQALAAGKTKRAYIGFEPSGRVHLGWKICADKITDLIEAGFDVTILLADWHAQINDKLGGDLDAIRACGDYMKECFGALGVPLDRVTFAFASDYVDDSSYWATVIQVAKHTSLARMRRAMDILGRGAEEGEHDTSKFLYPAMQVADIFHLGFDLAYGGLDQRHAHMLARDLAHKLGKTPPVALHTPLLPSLQASGRMDPVESKMSKSKPDSGILIHDTPADVERKMKGAVCPQGQSQGNPVLDLVRLVVFPGLLKRGRDDAFAIERPEKFGGPISYSSYDELEAAFVDGKLHPMDLKKATAGYINKVLEPVGRHFADNPGSLERVAKIVATR
jgi:tyrosyl-tRNA synthetase